MRDEMRLERWRERMEIPLFAASVLFLGCYAVRVLAVDLPEVWQDTVLAFVYALWALFVVDYAVRWRLSGDGPVYIRKHGLDGIVVLLPLLRPLRMVRIYESVQRRHADTQPRLPLYARVIAYSGMSAVLLGFAGALSVYAQERGAPSATIKTFGDSVWWTCETLTTVGYGDVAPVTALGRTIAVAMMIGGLALLGAVTGSFSSWLIQTFTLEADTKPPESGSPGAS
ncbi:potassium channel family protein [Streptomyces sp. NPDC005963]|uniref:potassium channel family protein n=1 Tax=Streptomyces sp. NPDC005963 TaxID=3156721 RepID=UPI0033D170F9